MFTRLIYRFLIAIPVTLSVFLVTILLFYKLPGLNVLDSERISVGSDRELASILREQENENPFSGSGGLFYFSLQPGFVPDSMYMVPVVFHTPFRQLSKEVRNPDVMNRYAVWSRRELKALGSGDSSLLSVRQIFLLLQAGNLENFRSSVESLGIDPSQWPEEWNWLMGSKPGKDLPWMRFRWTGKDNVFHHYLTGILWNDPTLYTLSGENVRQKFGRTIWWTLAYTIPVLFIGWTLVFLLVLWNYDKSRLLYRLDRVSMLLYSIPTFVLAVLALIFLSSHRYGVISELFPFPVFLDQESPGLWEIYRFHGSQLILPMILFALSPMLLFYRVFREKIRAVRQLNPSFRYLLHLGLSSRDFRIHYLSRYLMVATLALLSNLFVSVLGGSLVIEWIFNIPGLGRYMYESIVNYDTSSAVFLIFIFVIVQQLGHILSDFMIDYLYPSGRAENGLL